MAEKINMDYLRKLGDYEGTAKLDHAMLVVAVGTDQPEVILETLDKYHTIKMTGKFGGCAELEKYERLLRPHGVVVQKFDPIFVTGVRSGGKVALYRMIELKSAWLHGDGTLCRDPYCSRNNEHTEADTATIFRLTDKDDM